MSSSLPSLSDWKARAFEAKRLKINALDTVTYMLEELKKLRFEILMNVVKKF